MEKIKKILLRVFVGVLILLPLLALMVYTGFSIYQLESSKNSSGAVADIKPLDSLTTNYSIKGSGIFIPTFLYNRSTNIYNQFYSVIRPTVSVIDNELYLEFYFDYSSNDGYIERGDAFGLPFPVTERTDKTVGFFDDTYYVRFIISSGITDLSVFDNVTFGFCSIPVSANGSVFYSFEILYSCSSNSDLSIGFYFMFPNLPEYSSRLYYFSNAFSNSDGYQQGYSTGYQNGYSSGENVGYSNGYNIGNKVGYQNGYNAGVEYGGNYTFLGLIGAVIDAPVNAFIKLLNFDILGFNMLSLVTGLLTIGLIFAIIRIISGKGG